MSWENFEWKDDMPHDLDKTNFKWTDTSRIARSNFYASRTGYKSVAREMKKFNFHFWRRI